jgi:membrane-associated phospholipid phosphatase
VSTVVHADKYPPIERGRVAVRLVGGGALIALAVSLVGLGIVHLATPSGLTRWEDRVNTWFFLHRTPRLNNLSHIGSYLAETMTAVGILIVMFVLLRLLLGRWRESWTLFAAIAGELVIFLVVTTVVARPRPIVAHLDKAPPTSSFPSGHTGAAVVLYGCLAIIIVRQFQVRWLAVLLAIIFWAVPIVVGVSRLYRGMHHPLDVAFGALGSGIWLAIVVTTLLPQTVRHVDSPTGRPLSGMQHGRIENT